MKTFGKIMCVVLILLVLVALAFGIFVSCTPQGVEFWNNYKSSLEFVNDNTKYENRKKVEDSCRAMMATYKRDKIEYENNKKLYEENKKLFEDTGIESYLQQATDYMNLATGYRQQANNTVSTYNEYVLKNKSVWEDNVPADIDTELQYLE